LRPSWRSAAPWREARWRVALPGDLELVDVALHRTDILIGVVVYEGARDGELVQPYRDFEIFSFPMPALR
jgi:hypothetical protein